MGEFNPHEFRIYRSDLTEPSPWVCLSWAKDSSHVTDKNLFFLGLKNLRIAKNMNGGWSQPCWGSESKLYRKSCDVCLVSAMISARNGPGHSLHFVKMRARWRSNSWIWLEQAKFTLWTTEKKWSQSNQVIRDRLRSWWSTFCLSQIHSVPLEPSGSRCSPWKSGHRTSPFGKWSKIGPSLVVHRCAPTQMFETTMNHPHVPWPNPRPPKQQEHDPANLRKAAEKPVILASSERESTTVNWCYPLVN